MATPLEIFRSFDPPYERFDNGMLGPEFADELDLVSRLWFRCGYRPGIGAYREVTDSGAVPSGGISSPKVRELLRRIQERHVKVRIPPWMQTYFGFSLLENVEKQCAPLTAEEKRLHLAYMSKAYRIMDIRFSAERAALERFARSIEAEQAEVTENVARHSRHILRIGEMIGVPSAPRAILPMLPEPTRAVFEPLYPKVRPGPLARAYFRLLGRALLPKAVGAPRRAVPFEA